MLQCGAVCCSVVRCGAEWCSVVQCVAVRCSLLQSVAEFRSMFQCVGQCVAVYYSLLQCVAVCCSVLQCRELLKAFWVQIEGEKDWLTAAGDSNTLGESREKKNSQKSTQYSIDCTVN